jgi:hypothetical protein
VSREPHSAHDVDLEEAVPPAELRYDAIDFDRCSLRPDRRHRRIRPLLRASVHIHMRIFGSKRLSNRESNPCCRSSYQHNLISEPQVHSILRKKANAVFDSSTIPNDLNESVLPI